MKLIRKFIYFLALASLFSCSKGGDNASSYAFEISLNSMQSEYIAGADCSFEVKVSNYQVTESLYLEYDIEQSEETMTLNGSSIAQNRDVAVNNGSILHFTPSQARTYTINLRFHNSKYTLKKQIVLQSKENEYDVQVKPRQSTYMAGVNATFDISVTNYLLSEPLKMKYNIDGADEQITVDGTVVGHDKEVVIKNASVLTFEPKYAKRYVIDFEFYNSRTTLKRQAVFNVESNTFEVSVDARQSSYMVGFDAAFGITVSGYKWNEPLKFKYSIERSEETLLINGGSIPQNTDYNVSEGMTLHFTPAKAQDYNITLVFHNDYVSVEKKVSISVADNPEASMSVKIILPNDIYPDQSNTLYLDITGYKGDDIAYSYEISGANSKSLSYNGSPLPASGRISTSVRPIALQYEPTSLTPVEIIIKVGSYTPATVRTSVNISNPETSLTCSLAKEATQIYTEMPCDVVLSIGNFTGTSIPYSYEIIGDNTKSLSYNGSVLPTSGTLSLSEGSLIRFQYTPLSTKNAEIVFTLGKYSPKKCSITIDNILPIPTYQVSITAGTGGYVDYPAETQTVKHGTVITVTATPDINNRYAFDMWTDGSYEATRTIIVRKPINLKALFVKAR